MLHTNVMHKCYVPMLHTNVETNMGEKSEKLKIAF